mmetsp:Transcript_40613/g.68021  ORF Transcript_40613/g.68021 Transcript_40613/m.68021 type:complete len:250 (-) Transcript_40613:85-834(-)|eukprot:CAMPEP_0198203058 /NCGR_PEP_ID=MMETSP1445-20131203/6307_1 /TAXON_ID=36898 /ORGANISM="Pyramimonas sp., Strain CCMP2087" /LENGTH=249 /DNA_ID=CAMNT_0043874283 /DNA_START=213 /DNA_END=962 /DNA_ORIENTATION=-
MRTATVALRTAAVPGGVARVLQTTVGSRIGHAYWKSGMHSFRSISKRNAQRLASTAPMESVAGFKSPRRKMQLATVCADNQTNVEEDLNAKDVADYILRGKGAQGAIAQQALQWSVELTAIEYHVAPKVSQIREKSLQQFLASNLGANLRANLLSPSRINSPGTLLASAIIDNDDLSNAEAVCSQLEHIMRDRFERRCPVLRSKRVCISWNDRYTNLSTCSMRNGSMDLSLVVSLPDEEFAAHVEQFEK